MKSTQIIHNSVSILRNQILNNKLQYNQGIYSICSAHPDVLKACLQYVKEINSPLLIESTSNQVNPQGGYSGMAPQDFASWVFELASQFGFPKEQLILGGDHLGPFPWKEFPVQNSMQHAKELVSACVKAGYTKLHLDTSMRCADDPMGPLPIEIVSQRMAELCLEAEKTADFVCGSSQSKRNFPIYVIGTDVPPPGGKQSDFTNAHITTAHSADETWESARLAMSSVGLDNIWHRVIALVVQPGVEFYDDYVDPYRPDQVVGLCEWIKSKDSIVFEAHSTDYQTQHNLRKMVEDQFAILKVGPELTFAYREAIFALAAIEYELLSSTSTSMSKIRERLEHAMISDPVYWKAHYQGTAQEQHLLRLYSLKDRSRYYWRTPVVQEGLQCLFKNLTQNKIPIGLISQYFPKQVAEIQEQYLPRSPMDLINRRIKQVINKYSLACNME